MVSAALLKCRQFEGFASDLLCSWRRLLSRRLGRTTRAPRDGAASGDRRRFWLALQKTLHGLKSGGEKLHTCDNAIPLEADSGINLQNPE